LLAPESLATPSIENPLDARLQQQLTGAGHHRIPHGQQARPATFDFGISFRSGHGPLNSERSVQELYTVRIVQYQEAVVQVDAITADDHPLGSHVRF
jgi:hypothetical protein